MDKVHFEVTVLNDVRRAVYSKGPPRVGCGPKGAKLDIGSYLAASISSISFFNSVLTKSLSRHPAPDACAARAFRTLHCARPEAGEAA